MRPESLTTQELLREVMNKPDATQLEQVLAARLDVLSRMEESYEDAQTLIDQMRSALSDIRVTAAEAIAE